jgi:hypothetical protein
MNSKNIFGGILFTALVFLNSCESFNGDAVINKGTFKGPVSYRVYTYTPDSAIPAFRTYSEEYTVNLKENKEGLFIEYNSNKYHFDRENKINITTPKGYINYLRKSNDMDVDIREDHTYSDSTVRILGSGNLRKN